MESLTEIIVALIKNSLDANCTSIAIRICLELFWIQILDNGDGISREDLQSIGKCCLLNIDHDRKKPSKQFARLTGESLLSIIAQCEEVLIESVDSKTNHGKCHSRLFKQQTAISPRNEGSQRNFDSVSQYQYVRKSRGTTVTLKNVFYKNAERQRNHSIKEDYQTLLVKIRTLALVHYDRSFTVQDLANTEVVFKSKRLSAFLPKYCELYRLSETDIDVTTCRKDNVLIECYFSERRTRHPLSPIELTFINGLPSGELMPTVNELLTQEKHNIDFVIVVTFPKNDVLTQLNEPVVRNCLFRCLNQYKECLKRRKEQRHAISPVAPEIFSQTPISHSTMIEDDVKDVKFQQHHDEEDILYGLSQPVDDSQTTFDKCTKWLKTNDFDVPAEIGSTSKEQKHPSKKAPAANKERQKINFFDVAAGDDRRRINSSPQKKQTFKRPVPKFYPTKPNKKPEKLQKANKQPNFKKEFEVIERPPEKMSFLNIASEINVSRITMPLEETLPPANKLQQFAKKEKKKLLHSPPEAIPPFETKKVELTFFPEFEVSHPDEATSFLNDSCSPTEKKGCFQVTPQVEDVVETKTEPNIVHCLENFSSSSGSPDAVSSDISYAFAEPLFLEPILEPEDDTFNVGSPDARFFDFDLVQSYREFHKACRETIQYFKVAIEAIETSDCSSDEGCACCNTHQFNREIEILRQPFHQPRNILAKVGPRR
ncbi:uncharacterized protein LOC5564224 [Aedes aegypti]|uniref:DNA mismatch repair protein S5 domain-containing protein n=1 Tax=Aedes aegypti TaxID=7159 RepID=A0A6I8T6X5_AEDAE|nr:uncharacterized protein LOC5564224 [Aedes aegypti]